MRNDPRKSLVGLSVALAVSLGATSLDAQAAPADDARTLSLSDAQKAELLAHNTEGSVDDARAGLGSANGPDRKIHGEIGGLIGSNGSRAAFGSALVPLGDNAQAAVSFYDSRYGRHR